MYGIHKCYLPPFWCLEDEDTEFSERFNVKQELFRKERHICKPQCTLWSSLLRSSKKKKNKSYIFQKKIGCSWGTNYTLAAEKRLDVSR